jgi:hypothetical protein|tara:strand:- start:91 stop:1008 length:918 start_codon:yes stop_codon:yes gene_type:complete
MNFGKVVDVNDKLKLGRVKVKVVDLHDNIKTEDLSWSQVMMPANTPAINGTGHSVNLAVGSLVVGMFKDIEQQEFIVTGSLPTKTDSVEDNNVRVRAEADPNAGETRGTYQPGAYYAPEYPYNNVYETESGHVKEYDDTPGYERITERHKSGTNYVIDGEGSKNETIVRDNYRLVVGQDTLEVYGNVRVIISGHADIAVAGNLTAGVNGNMESTVVGNIAATSTTGNVTTTSTEGDITVTTADTTKKITLAGNVDITENLTVAKDVEVTGNTLTKGTTHTSTSQKLDSHVHGNNNVNQINTNPLI